MVLGNEEGARDTSREIVPTRNHPDQAARLAQGMGDLALQLIVLKVEFPQAGELGQRDGDCPRCAFSRRPGRRRCASVPSSGGSSPRSASVPRRALIT